MTTATNTSTDTRPANTEEQSTTHLVCIGCGFQPDNRIIALCGEDVSHKKDKGWHTKPEPNDCLVCIDLDTTHNC